MIISKKQKQEKEELYLEKKIFEEKIVGKAVL